MKRLVLYIFLLISISSSADTIKGKVVRVSDGDTFTLLLDDKTQVKVRLHGVDCPESKQDFGNRAKDFTAEYIAGKEINVIVTGTDFYKRKLGVVPINSTTLNILLLQNGLAWHYKQYDKSVEYATAESYARNKKIGLWSIPNPMAPWDFRKMKKQQRKK